MHCLSPLLAVWGVLIGIGRPSLRDTVAAIAAFCARERTTRRPHSHSHRPTLSRPSHSRLYVPENIRPALYKSFHLCLPAKPCEGPRVLCDVVGPVCESADFLAQDRSLPRPASGTAMVVFDSGAYCRVMGSNYNMRVCLAGRARVARDAQGQPIRLPQIHTREWMMPDAMRPAHPPASHVCAVAARLHSLWRPSTSVCTAASNASGMATRTTTWCDRSWMSTSPDGCVPDEPSVHERRTG